MKTNLHFTKFMSLSILAVLSIFFISYFSVDAHSAYAASPGLINGTVFIDSNLNGIKDVGELGKSGVQITLTGTLSNGTAITPRNVNSGVTGAYAFNQLLSGTYTVTEADISGWAHTSPKIIGNINIGSGTLVTKNFGNIQLGTITARPFNDANANGVQDVGESLVSGWSFTLTGTLSNGTVISPKVVVSSPIAAFSNLYPGTYVLTETNQAGFAQSTVNPVTGLALSSGGSLSSNFGNFKLGIITARPFNDSNSNGVQDAGEALVSGWNISLNGKFSNGANTPTVNIISGPTAVFSNIFPGNYNLTESDQAGFTHTTPSTISNIFISGSGNNTSFNFGNKKTALVGNSLINGTVFLDSNLNGILDTGELGKKSWPITLTGTLNNGTILLPITINSSSTGLFSFNKLSPGTYTLTESDISGWVHTSTSVIGSIVLNTNSFVTENFGNVQPSIITARPFNDSNSNGVQDGGESLVPGWTFTLSGNIINGTTITPVVAISSPVAMFANIYPGNYSLSITSQPGFTLTTPSVISNIIENATNGNAAFNFGIFKASSQIKLLVYNDTNGDGVKDGTDQGLQNWNVTLTQSGHPLSTLTTTSNGTFTIPNLSSGIYNLTLAQIPNPYLLTQPLNNSYSISITSSGQQFKPAFGVFKNSTSAFTGFGDIVSISPEGLAMDSHGLLYDVDTFGNQIKVFYTNGTFIRNIGNQSGVLNSPGGLTIDSHDNIYTTDQTNRVLKFAPNGTNVLTIGSKGVGLGQFNFPRGVSVDSSGNIYVADTNNHRIQKFNSLGNYLATIAKAGVPSGYVRLPFDVHVVDNTSLFVADTGNNRIDQFDLNGKLLSTFGHFGTDNGEFNRPRNVAIDSNGFAYVSDTYNNRIEVFDNNFNFVRSWGVVGSASGQFLNPSGLLIDSKGILYVADISNDRIQEFYTNGTFITQFKTRLSQMEPYFVNFDQNGILLTSDGHNHKILGFNATTSDLVLQFGTLGTAPGELRGPRGIGIDSHGNRIIAEDYNNRVSKFDASGNFIMTWGGTGVNPGQFRQPRGVIIDPSDNIYVADTQNNRIQKFDNNGNYITSFNTTLPYQIAFDKDFNIYAADENAHYVDKIAPNGTELAQIGVSGPGQLSIPRGVYVDHYGMIFVGDSAKNRIEKFSPSGNFLGGFGSNGTGPGQFSDPRGILVDSSGNIWVDDTANLRIQEFDKNFNFIKIIMASFGENGGVAPTVTASPPGGIYNSAQSVMLTTPDEPSTIYYTSDGSSPTTSSSQFTIPIAINQSTTLNFFAKDILNVTGPIVTQSYVIDTVAPTITITSPSNNTSQNTGTLNIVGTASDVGTGVQSVVVSIDGFPYTTANGTNSWTFSGVAPFDGLHTITVKATDLVGNTATTSINVRVDTVFPTITILSPSNGTDIPSAKVFLTGNAVDIGSGIQRVLVSVDGGAFSLANNTNIWNFTTASLTSGSHTMTAKAMDLAGNSVNATVNVTVSPQLVTITSVSNNSPVWGVPPVTISGTVAGPVVSGDTVFVNWGDGSSTTGIPISRNSWGPVTHTYSSGAMSTNPNSIIATWISSGFVTKGSSSPTTIIVLKHSAVLSLNQANNVLWSKPTSFSVTMTDSNNGNSSLSGMTISFNGTGVIGVSNPTTNISGMATGTGTAPNTAALGWTYQAQFAGNSLYYAAVSPIKIYNTLPHNTSTVVGSNPQVSWGFPTSFTASLVDLNNGNTAIAAKTIHFNGTGVIGVTDQSTDSTGKAKGTGTAPTTIAAGWKYQAHFGGNSQYAKSDSTTGTYTTIARNSQLQLVVPTSVVHGATYSIGGVLVDSNNSPIVGRTITFTADSPIVIGSAVTDSTGKYIVTGLTAPSAGTYHITAHFAGDSLYNLSNSQQKTLNVS